MPVLSSMSCWRGRRRLLVLGLFLLGLVFFLASCGAPPAELGFEEISKRFTGLRLDAYEKHQGEHHQVIEVREQRFLTALKQALREAKPASGVPDPNIWRDYSISFTLPGGREAGPYDFIYGEPPRFKKSAYIEFPEGWYEVPGQFNSLLEALMEYPSASAEVDPADEDFLRQYGWSPFFRINTFK